jgi:hypothetical protein
VPAYKIYATTSVPVTTTSANPDLSIKNIEKTITDGTPNFISGPIIFITEKIEKFRLDMGFMYENRKKAMQSEIEVMTSRIDKNQFLKVVEYAKLFFFKILSFIFSTKWLFYFIFIVLVLKILSIIWHLFFP